MIYDDLFRGVTVTPKLDGWTLVVPGFWNPRIFSPEWLQARGLIEPGQQVALALPVNAAGPPQLSFGGVRLRVDGQLLVVGTDSPDDVRLQRMERVLTTVLELLSHTPVAAVGVNFQWVEETPPGAVMRCFDVRDSADLADAGLEIQETTVTRRLNDNGRTLNLTLRLGSNGEVHADFNFHFEVNSATRGRELVTGQVVALRNRALEILESVYALEALPQ